MEAGRKAEAYEARLGEVIGNAADALRRRWKTLAIVAAGVFLIGLVAVSTMTPQYAATAKVRLDPSRNPLASNGQTHRAELTAEAIETEATAVRSLELARAIVRSQKLIGDPEFADGPGSGGSDVSDIAMAVLSRVSVNREQMAYILDISFTSADPLKAARLANAFADGYIASRTTSKIGTAERQSAWFEQRLSELSKAATAAEARAADYRARAGIVESSTSWGAVTISDQQVAPLASSLANAESEAAAARSNLIAARAQIAHGGLDAVSEVLGSPVVADLRRQRAEVLRSTGEIETRYGDRHPETMRVRNQLAALDSQVDAEARRIVESLQATATAAEARADRLRGTLDALEHEREQGTRASVTADGLDREAGAKRALYDRMSQLSLESMQAARLSIAQADVIERAEPPQSPAIPDKPLLYALSLVASLAAGAGTVGMMELTGGGFRSVEDVQDRLGLPVLAAVPRLHKGEDPTRLLLERPGSMFAESYRIARAAVLGVKNARPAKVIALTSSLPAEGKTTSAVAFARTLAIAGARTLLVDCDLRRATAGKMLRTPAPSAGLVEVLRGAASVEAAIHAGDIPKFDQLLVLTPVFLTEDLFGAGRMEKLLTGLRDRYDHVVLDLPPLMGLADGRVLASLADSVALILKWNSTPISAVKSALDWLRSDGSHAVGVIYTQVDQNAPALGGLSYYAARYANYYQKS